MSDDVTESDADELIAAAEQRLAIALDDLERARQTLMQRERELLELLARLGRLPIGVDAGQVSQSGS